ncbi:hypothetical protein FHS34_004322 [Streptomyces echinatus]|uniref:Uncharacterized protein n=1 Tax=Streptomyces echinatus TaxID=67293 RepID=A0A7W9PXG6_9ACTN|nr:hypothetical protein [Streptomyces echinatus]
MAVASGGASFRVTVMALPVSFRVPARSSRPPSFSSSALVLPSSLSASDSTLSRRVALDSSSPFVLAAALLDQVGQLQQGAVLADVGALGRVEAGEEDQPGEGENGGREHPHRPETQPAGGAAR